MIGFCEKCDKKSICTELCDLCEDYVSQDHVPIKEGLININIENRENGVDWGIIDLPDDTLSCIIKARYRWAIIELYKEGKSTREIAYHVPYSQSQIVRIIQKHKESDS